MKSCDQVDISLPPIWKFHDLFYPLNQPTSRLLTNHTLLTGTFFPASPLRTQCAPGLRSISPFLLKIAIAPLPTDRASNSPVPVSRSQPVKYSFLLPLSVLYTSIIKRLFLFLQNKTVELKSPQIHLTKPLVKISELPLWPWSTLIQEPQDLYQQF